MFFAGVIGWLFGRQRRETRRAGKLAALPEAEKERRAKRADWDRRHKSLRTESGH